MVITFCKYTYKNIFTQVISLLLIYTYSLKQNKCGVHGVCFLLKQLNIKTIDSVYLFCGVCLCVCFSKSDVS